MRKVLFFIYFIILLGVFLLNTQDAQAKHWNRNAYDNPTKTVIYNVPSSDSRGVNCEGLYGTVSANWWPGGTARVFCRGQLSCPGEEKYVTPTPDGTTSSSGSYNGTAEFDFGNCNCYFDQTTTDGTPESKCLEVDNLPADCTVSTGLTCGSNGDPATIASFNISCPEPIKPTVRCEAKDASGNTVTSVSSGQPVTWTATADGGSYSYTSYSWSGDANTSSTGSTSISTYTVTSSTPKTARVTVTDSNGQTSTPASSCSVTVNPCTCNSTTAASLCPANKFADTCNTANACPGTKSCNNTTEICRTADNSCVPKDTKACTTNLGTTSKNSDGTYTVNASITLSNITGVTRTRWTMDNSEITPTTTYTSLTRALSPVTVGGHSLTTSVTDSSGTTTNCSTITFTVGSVTTIDVPLAGAGTFGWENNISVNCGPPYDDNLANLTLDWTSSNNASYYEIWRKINTNAWRCMRGDRSNGNPRNCNGDAIPASQTSYLDDNMALYDSGGAQQYGYIVASLVPGGNTCISNLTGQKYGSVDCNVSGDWVKLENICKPDLVVTNISYTPSNPRVNDPMTFTATVKNDGYGARANWFNNNLCIDLDSDNTCDNDWTKNDGFWNYSTSSSIPLNQGESRSVTWSYTSALPALRLGSHKATVCADFNPSTPNQSNIVSEINEGNNCRSVDYRVTTICDPQLIGNNEFKGCLWHSDYLTNFDFNAFYINWVDMAISTYSAAPTQLGFSPLQPLPLSSPVPNSAKPLQADFYNSSYLPTADSIDYPTFSARWKGFFNFKIGSYTFTYNTGTNAYYNPIRVSINGQSLYNGQTITFIEPTRALIEIQYAHKTQIVTAAYSDSWAADFIKAFVSFGWDYVPPPIVVLKARPTTTDFTVPFVDTSNTSPLVINANTSAQLSWTSTNATSCTAFATPTDSNWRSYKALNNTGPTYPSTSSLLSSDNLYIYTLRCTNGYPVSDSVYIKVPGAPWVQTSGDVHSNQ